MGDIHYREYRPADVPALSLLWREVFGDSLRFTANFFALLPDMGSFVVAEEDGVLLGGAGILNGFELVTRQKRRPIVAYLYAVMVREDARGRGIGKQLCREAAMLAKRREQKLNDWVAGKLKSTYVRMNDQYKDCKFQYQGWVK